MRRRIAFLVVATISLIVLSGSLGNAQVIAGSAEPMDTTQTTFAIISDEGMNNWSEAQVANLVASWNPAYIISAGDNYNAPAGGTGTGQYDESVGAYYGAWLKDITTTGTRCPVGLASINAFFPAMGNHDYSDPTPAGPETYLEYFTLPGTDFTNTSGNERYYDFVQGPIHFFILDSNPDDPDGCSSTSKQAQWLKARLARSTSTWNIVCDHHPPYSSDEDHGSTDYMQWPFAEWGADAVISGHAHVYERIMRDDIVYFVNGLGGSNPYVFVTPVSGSTVRYSENWGAQKVTVTDATLTFDFYSIDGTLIDSYQLPSPPTTAPTAPSDLLASIISTSQATLSWIDTADNEDGFKIERSADGVTWTQVATVGADTVTFTNSGLSSNTTLSFTAAATDGQVSTSGADWARVQGATQGTRYATGDIEVGSRLFAGTYYCSRGYLAFDCGALPVGEALQSAYLTLTREGAATGDDDFFACASNQYDATALSPYNYDGLGTAKLTDAINLPTADTPTRFDFNFAGLAYLSSTGPYKWIGLRDRADIENTVPVVDDESWLWASEATESAYRPMLTLVYAATPPVAYFRVRAYNSAGDSEYSNVATSHVNHAPVAVSDTYTVGRDMVLTASAASGVRANDTDPDADLLAAHVVTTTAHGSLSLATDGSFTYTPTARYVGVDTFTYKVNDRIDDSNVATVTITIAAPPAVPAPVYRFYNLQNGSHFYTASADERDTVIATYSVYKFEGAAYTINTSNPDNSAPLYRFYNKKNGSHFYTVSASERDTVIATWPDIYSYDGPAYNVCATNVTDSTPVYRFYNVTNGSHFYTASDTERDAVIANWPNVYRYEGPAFWLAP